MFANAADATQEERTRTEESVDRTSRSTQVVRTLFEDHLDTGRLEGIDQLLAPDFAGPNGERGPAEFAATIATLRTAFPDIHFTIQDLFAEGDRVAIRWTWQGTHAGPLRQIAATGRPVHDSGIAIYQLRDGRIARAWTETDRLGVLQQIRAIAAAPTLRPGAQP